MDRPTVTWWRWSELGSPSDRPSRRRVVRVPTAIVLSLMAMVATVVVGASGPAGRAAAQADDPAQELADRYAPVIMLKQQDDECDADGEQYEPTSVDILLDNPQILLRQVGTQNPVVRSGASASDLFDLGEGFYLDFPGDALAPECVYERDFRRYSDGRRATVYAHVRTQDDRPGQLALQYWFFWYYNDWNNRHEGDWEGIQLVFDAGSVEEALAGEPVSVGYAQHEGGERAEWGDVKLERRGFRPIVYSSAGSHASYFSSALYLGRSGSEGFGCDNTDGPLREVDPEVVVLPTTVDDPDDQLAWLAFEGRWGELQSGPFNGPTGPAFKERWDRPIDWHDDLRSSSVIVPGGDDAAASLTNTFCGVVEFGSGQLITLQQNPVIILIAILVIAVLLTWAVRRTEWTKVPPLPIVRRRRIGQILRAAASLYRHHTVLLLAIGLIYIPVALLVGGVVALVARIGVVGTLAEADGDIGAVGAVIVVVIAALGHNVGLFIVRGIVAIGMRELGDDQSNPGRTALTETRARLADLVGVVARAVAIVAVLTITIVGIPWAVRQVVRYQFAPETTMLENRHSVDALARSSELVRGRWLHTAFFVLLVGALVSLFTTVIGLLLLVVLSGIPLWLFSIVVTTLTAFIVPFSAAASILLYGDAKAEQGDTSSSAPVAADETLVDA